MKIDEEGWNRVVAKARELGYMHCLSDVWKLVNAGNFTAEALADLKRSSDERYKETETG